MEQAHIRIAAKPATMVGFYDDFVEFHDSCSFLCDAVACMIEEQEQFDYSTTLGIKRYCYWIKDRVQALKEELSQLQECLTTEQQGLDASKHRTQ